MTLSELLTLPAGLDLDLAVAEIVFCRGAKISEPREFYPSFLIEHAVSVVREVGASNTWLIECSSEGCKVSIVGMASTDWDEGICFTGRDERDLPLCICRCAIKAAWKGGDGG